MDSNTTEEALLKSRSRMITSIIIDRHQKLKEQIEGGVFEIKFSMYDLVKDTKQVTEKATGTERSG
ncbi:MAG TPA: hypothetical protein VKC53_02080 [Patescibacteria group bacterium]|nr:hypothetical protein [Patescibacteria group bacterium]